MLFLIKLIGLVITCLGLTMILRPELMDRMIGFWEQGKRLYWAGAVRILFGIILLLGASQCRITGLVIFFGILFILGGILIYAVGLDKAKSMIKWWKGRDAKFQRIMSGIAAAIGALILFAA